MLHVHEVVGVIGVAILLITYLLLQIDRIAAQSMTYSLLNAAGSGLILVSLTVDFNLAAFAIEVCWFVISCVGAIVTLRRWRDEQRQRSQ